MDDVHLNYLYNRLNLDYKLDYYLEKQFNIRELSKKKYDYLINCFEKKISLTNQELLYLKNKFTINELYDLIGIMYYEQLKLFDLRKLLKVMPDINIYNMLYPKPTIYLFEVLKHNYDYEYGKMENNYYLRYYDILVIEYNNKTLESVHKLLDNRYAFRIYKNKDKYHVFIISQRINHNDTIQLNITNLYNGDSMFSYYSFYNGYMINDIDHEFIGLYGNTSIIDEYLNDILIDTLERHKYESRTFFYDKILNLKCKTNIPESYTDYLLKSMEMNVNEIKNIALYYNFKKPQRYLYAENDFYVGVDLNSNLHYICYNDIAMFDIHSNDLNEVINLLDNNSYMIYKSLNGYHIYLTNRRIEYDSDEAIEFMIKIGCDVKYIIFTHLRGYCTRISRKKYEGVYELVHIHNKEKQEQLIVDLVDLHIFFAKQFWNI